MYQITKQSKEIIEANLIRASVVVASIPDRYLEGEFKKEVQSLLNDLQETSRMLENLKPVEWQDQESDVQSKVA